MTYKLLTITHPSMLFCAPKLILADCFKSAVNTPKRGTENIVSSAIDYESHRLKAIVIGPQILKLSIFSKVLVYERFPSTDERRSCSLP